MRNRKEYWQKTYWDFTPRCKFAVKNLKEKREYLSFDKIFIDSLNTISSDFLFTETRKHKPQITMFWINLRFIAKFVLKKWIIFARNWNKNFWKTYLQSANPTRSSWGWPPSAWTPWARQYSVSTKVPQFKFVIFSW